MTSTSTSRSNSTDPSVPNPNTAMESSTPTSSTTSSREPSAHRASTRPQRPAIDPLRQTYPKPTDEIDMDTAMDRRPGRWSFRGQLKQQQEREEEQTRRAALENASGKNREELEAAKKDLMNSFAELNR